MRGGATPVVRPPPRARGQVRCAPHLIPV